MLELVVFRKWCHKLCPMGALFSLLSQKNRTVHPEVNSQACLLSHGQTCNTCVTRCPEELDPHTRNIPECTKCGICVESCPAHAISVRLLAGSAAREGSAVSGEAE